MSSEEHLTTLSRGGTLSHYQERRFRAPNLRITHIYDTFEGGPPLAISGKTFQSSSFSKTLFSSHVRSKVHLDRPGKAFWRFGPDSRTPDLLPRI